MPSNMPSKVQMPEEGNTEPLPNTRRSRGWCFTLNNYTENERKDIEQWLLPSAHQYIVGEEVGEQGTPHLQGYVYVENKMSLKQMKAKIPRAHFEVAKDTPKQNRAYCSKDGKFIEHWNPEKESPEQKLKKRKEHALKRYENIEWKPWQADVLEKLSQPADDRTVYWVYDAKGGNGKSFLCKYLYLTRNVIIADGKKDNIFNQMNIKVNEQGLEPEIVMLDIPRCGQAYMNYGVIEQIKNGLIYSGKYEGGDVIFDAPHIIIFANFEPDYAQFTSDRWNVINLDE